MCGRFTLISSMDLLKRIFKLNRGPLMPPNYNIAPTQPVAAVRQNSEGERELSALRWGLIPSWAKDKSFGAKAINAQSETVFEKNAFRWPVRKQRCLIPADGFYEWKTEGKKKQPFFIRVGKDMPFAFAGIWDSWKDPDENTIESCSILTTDANSLIQLIHPRMPVILSPDDYDVWLDPALDTPNQLSPLLKPYPPETMTVYPVRPRVNSFTNNDPQLIEPYWPHETGVFF